MRARKARGPRTADAVGEPRRVDQAVGRLIEAKAKSNPAQRQTPPARPWPFGRLRRHDYRVILADAAYKFAAGPSRNPANHYPTMSIRELAALPVGELAHPEGARLFNWTPCCQLHHALKLVEAWGFTFCTVRPWLKALPSRHEWPLPEDAFAVGTGYEARNTSELIIIAKTRNPKPPPLGNERFAGHIIAPRREHSRKPDEVRDEIVRLLEGPRCELFARSTHHGFEAWGNEIGKFI